MDPLALTNVTVLTPFNLIEDAVILIRDQKIFMVGSMDSIEIPSDFRQVPLEGLIIGPGFIDQHLHGGSGSEVMTGTPDSLIETARFHATHGTTSFLATTTSGTHDQMMNVAKSFAALNAIEYKGAKCLGLHLEGPFISAEFPGVHFTEHIRPPFMEEIISIHRLSKNGVKLITMAPELPGALELAQNLTRVGIICSIGHSAADYKTSLNAISAGFKGVTHCFNQMQPFHHRDPGLIGAALTRPELSIELIVDGIHLHKAAVDIAWRSKGPDGVILVSDAMAPAGLIDGVFETSIGELKLTKGILKNNNGKLAGSVLTIEQAIKNLLYYTDCSLSDAFKAATYNPARFLGINKRKGSLYPGKDADLVIMTTDLEVAGTMINGEIISGLISLD